VAELVRDNLLTFIVLAPLVGCVVLLLLPAHMGLLIRLVALAGAGLTLPPALLLALHYNRGLGGFQFDQRIPWVPSLGISYHVAVDGTSVVLVLLTAIIITGGVCASWTHKHRTKEFLALLLLLVSGVFGVFVARDLFFLFLFYEIAVLPMYLLIGVWGTSSKLRTKEVSAMKLTLMLLAGSAFILVAILSLYFTQQPHSFDLDDLASRQLDPALQRWLFLAVYVGFGVLAGIFPFHTWSPDGHASAPTAVSMLHAGVLMKLGAYGVLRLGLGLMPEGAAEWAPVMATIATINIVYGAYAAMGQTDLKYIVAYSSVSHMGVVMLGLASLNTIGVNGSVMQMFSHGIMTGLFFAVVGLVYEKSHTRDIQIMGGFARRMPGIAVVMTVGGMASFGLPATSGFIAELLCFYGMWLKYPVLAVISVGGIVLTAIYVLRAIQRIFLGPFRETDYPDLPDARTSEWPAIVALASLLILFGVWPRPLVDLIDSGLRSVPAVKVAAAQPGPALWVEHPGHRTRVALDTRTGSRSDN
jgi:NADH-quinone oxidoreductase subunit M